MYSALPEDIVGYMLLGYQIKKAYHIELFYYCYHIIFLIDQCNLNFLL